jgi:hypothetical protein
VWGDAPLPKKTSLRPFDIVSPKGLRNLWTGPTSLFPPMKVSYFVLPPPFRSSFMFAFSLNHIFCAAATLATLKCPPSPCVPYHPCLPKPPCVNYQRQPQQHPVRRLVIRRSPRRLTARRARPACRLTGALRLQMTSVAATSPSYSLVGEVKMLEARVHLHEFALGVDCPVKQ